MHCCPAVQVVEAMGEVMNRVASAEGAKARAKTAMVERNIVYARLKGYGVGVGLLGDF